MLSSDKHISKVERGSLPGKGDLYFYNPTKITDPSNGEYFVYHTQGGHCFV